MLIERDNNMLSAWRALDVFTKGRRSISADVPKNLTANVFSNHFLCVAESLRNREQLYMSAQIFHMIYTNKKTRGSDPFVIPYLSVSELYINTGKSKIVWPGWYKQAITKPVITIHNRLAYIYF